MHPEEVRPLNTGPGPVVAFAGRRIDPHRIDPQLTAGGREAPPAVERFPAENATRVGAEIARVLEALGARWLVSAAACGADILALEAAAGLGLRRRVVLPAPPAVFRESSVIDRPGDWGTRYDRIIAAVTLTGDLVLHTPPCAGLDDLPVYFAANLAILDEAARIASEESRELQALVAWNGHSRGADDVTAHFLDEARRRHLPVTAILTLQR